MVDAQQAAESDYLNADIVRESKGKKAVIINAGSYEDVTFNNETKRRLTLDVMIDDKVKQWRPNRSSVANIINEFGKDTERWVDKVINLQVIKIQGKDSVLATAVAGQKVDKEDVIGTTATKVDISNMKEHMIKGVEVNRMGTEGTNLYK